MRKFIITMFSEEAGLVSAEQEADGFHYQVDSGVFNKGGTATFYALRSASTKSEYNDSDNIAVYRGVTRVTESKPAPQPTGGGE